MCTSYTCTHVHLWLVAVGVYSVHELYLQHVYMYKQQWHCYGRKYTAQWPHHRTLRISATMTTIEWSWGLSIPEIVVSFWAALVVLNSWVHGMEERGLACSVVLGQDGNSWSAEQNHLLKRKNCDNFHVTTDIHPNFLVQVVFQQSTAVFCTLWFILNISFLTSLRRCFVQSPSD